LLSQQHGKTSTRLPMRLTGCRHKTGTHLGAGPIDESSLLGLLGGAAGGVMAA